MTECTFRVRWDEVDPIGHLRHTGYSAYAAQARVELFESVGIDTNFAAVGVAPILFREELVYRREVRLGQAVRVTSRLTQLTADAGRWTIEHELIRPDDELAARVHTDGAWIDLTARSLAAPPTEVATKMRRLAADD